MNKLIKTVNYFHSHIKVPGSKSIANRALIASALSNGVSELKNFPSADDTIIMLEALKKFGVDIKQTNDSLIVYGNSSHLKAPDKKIHTGNAGTVMRFLTSFSALADGTTILTGDERMLQRPISGLADALNNLGVDISTNNGYPPVKIKGPKFPGGTTTIDARFSSQFISSILLSSPYAEKKVTILTSSPVPSKSYIDITIDVMKQFGVNVEKDNSSYSVNPEAKYESTVYSIEGDYSSAAYFILAALITNSIIEIENLKMYSLQPDSIFLNLAREMGCEIFQNYKGIKLDARNAQIKNFVLNANNFPDLVPALSVLALFADGVSRIMNVEHLRYKETDRLKAITNELTKLGAYVEELSDGLIISPSRQYNSAEIKTYNDHRIAMSFAVAGLKISGISIENPECVKKSFPEFWNEFEKLY